MASEVRRVVAKAKTAAGRGRGRKLKPPAGGVKETAGARSESAGRVKRFCAGDVIKGERRPSAGPRWPNNLGTADGIQTSQRALKQCCDAMLELY